ncbi:MAG TPA: helix-turn-helix transcriptional regulator [Flavobacteriaceae bacterium]|nr:helix-turn-helix transcriptional regulator [Flavobacteriaceae bacterium]
MINSENFAKRLQKVIAFYGETSSSFAEKIGVQRSSISHILSGRNKPSLDFVLKILYTYPDVEMYWLLNGKGNFPSAKEQETPIQPKTKNIKESEQNNKNIERIVIFYSDGSFENFEK